MRISAEIGYWGICTIQDGLETQLLNPEERIDASVSIGKEGRHSEITIELYVRHYHYYVSPGLVAFLGTRTWDIRSSHDYHVGIRGCAKNLVDSERILAILKINFFLLMILNRLADMIVINTCGLLSQPKRSYWRSLDMRPWNKRTVKFGGDGCLVQQIIKVILARNPGSGSRLGTWILKPLGGASAMLHCCYREPVRTDVTYRRCLDSPSLGLRQNCWGIIIICTFAPIPSAKGGLMSAVLWKNLGGSARLTQSGVRNYSAAQDTTVYRPKISMGSYVKGLQLGSLVKETSMGSGFFIVILLALTKHCFVWSIGRKNFTHISIIPSYGIRKTVFWMRWDVRNSARD